ncbi:polysaccharide deacetylase family protein [Candidatus Bathyarchaeota archaeon]|nr:polysaccharide deacetylase family protein [Candidatus Bathyarchaeota archaeon]
MKHVTIFFDLEAPFLWKDEPRFDLEEALRNISEILQRFGAKAVFNTCGILASKFPKSIALLHDEGHEIASHGYAHENFLNVSATKLDDLLAKTEQVLQGVTGEKPLGIRTPWLVRNEEIYDVLRKRNYGWTSNWHVPFWETKSRVDLGATSYARWMLGRVLYGIKRFSRKEKPFRVGSLLEIPLLSPMDIYCIYPFPQAEKNSPESSLEEAYSILVEHYKHSEEYFNLNFHEHIIGTANRVRLLERMLEYLSAKSDVRFILPHQLS